jgi:DNA-directed RNA polymerase subunit beta'
LVDVSQDIIIREDDCNSTEGIYVETIMDGKQVLEELQERLVGKYLLEDYKDPNTGEVICDTNTLINDKIADKIVNTGIKRIQVRSILGCKCKHGACSKCYGMGLATRKRVNIGESVGIIAAQSIGEPGTQLTMRTFHTGGVAGEEDITQGLPRVQELFEARNPKAKATIAEIDGEVTKITEDHGKFKIAIKNDVETKEHVTNYGAKLRVEKGDKVVAGEKLTEGAISPKELLSVTDPLTTQEYILKEVQYTYRSQGVDISDKHIEIIASKMINKIRIVEGGGTNFLPGTLVGLQEFTDANKEVQFSFKDYCI